MFNTMIGKYYPIDSKIHEMNSISKIICTIIFIIMLAFSNSIITLLLMIILTLGMMLLSNVPMILYLKNIYSIKILLILIFIMDIVFRVPIDISLIMLIKVILGVLYTIVLVYTTSTSEITYGLEKVFSPLKYLNIPVNKIALSISLALRFIPTIYEQGERVLKSQASRGIDFYHSDIREKIIALSSMIVPMFILSIRRADNLADAMEVRSYNCNSRRTNCRINKWHVFDDMMIVLHVGILIFFVLRSVF